MSIKTFINQAHEATLLLIDTFTPGQQQTVLHKLADKTCDVIETVMFAINFNQPADDLWDHTTREAQKAADRLAEAEAEQDVWPGPEPETGHSLTLDNPLLPKWTPDPSRWLNYAGTDAPWSRPETTANPTPEHTGDLVIHDRLEHLTTITQQVLDTLTEISSAVRAQPVGQAAAAAPAEDAPPPHNSPVGVGHPNQNDELKTLLLAALLKKAAGQ
jgi:hypothetical protein